MLNNKSLLIVSHVLVWIFLFILIKFNLDTMENIADLHTVVQKQKLVIVELCKNNDSDKCINLTQSK